MADQPDYRRGLDDYHDPTAGIGGAAPARSALTLRLVLAAFGLVFCGVTAVVAVRADLVVVVIILGILAVVALIDLVVVARRKARGEPG
jgi:1,4-dihydroxy-2-naphthoate octaprenyltransferase